MPDPTAVPDAARCRGCGYPLRTLTTRRCPECGRPFDPADPTTLDVGRRPGRLGQLLLRPTGWPLAIVAVGAAVAVVTATRWPAGRAVIGVTDWVYYFRGGRVRRDRLLSSTDWAYVAGLLAIAIVLIAWLLRSIARPWAQRRYGRPPTPVSLGRRAALAAVAAVALVAAGGGVAVGWPYRLARLWARQLLAAVRRPSTPNVYTPPVGPIPPPVPLTDAQQLQVLETGILRLPTTAERTACLRLLTELPGDALPVLLDLLPRQTDPVVRATIARLIGLHRDPKTVDALLALWDDPDPDVRAAVTDAAGIVHQPTYPLSSSWSNSSALSTDPPIPVSSFNADTVAVRLAANDVGPGRSRLVDRVTAGRSDAEREAAARGLLAWPSPAYRLRVAEWGVWVANQTGSLTLVQSLLDEIPPFVHPTGDSVASMSPRIETNFIVTKPILHLTADQLMTVDVQVVISDGRPWFAYPLPHDFVLSVQFVEGIGPLQPLTSPLAAFDRAGRPGMTDPGEGYPWALPRHRTQMAATTNGIDAMGLRWQSVVVSPTRLAWMSPPTVPADVRFAWWERLRQVECSWVANRGEAERFLYYDGPTSAKAPIAVAFDGRTLRFVDPDPPSAAGADPLRGRGSMRSFEPLVTLRPANGNRRGLFVRVAAGVIGGTAVDWLQAGHVLDPANPPALAGEPAVADALLAMLTAAGLSAGEAAGLVDCWRPQLFHTNGSRFLLLMTAADYDALCPIRIDPPPTELVRVGLVLTEFGP